MATQGRGRVDELHMYGRHRHRQNAESNDHQNLSHHYHVLISDCCAGCTKDQLRRVTNQSQSHRHVLYVSTSALHSTLGEGNYWIME